MIWSRDPCATSYNVYRFTGVTLVDSDKNGVADTYGTCYQADLPTNEMTDAGAPPRGSTSFHVVSGENAVGEGTIGFASNHKVRPNTSPCP